MFETEEAIIQNLKDAGCRSDTIDAFMDNLKTGRKSEGLKALDLHRRRLLEEIHQEQKRLDCLDYLVYQLKKEA